MAKDSQQPFTSSPFSSRVSAESETAPGGAEKTEFGTFPDDIAPAILRSQQTFREVLPKLLKTRYRQWVAIENGEIIDFARSKTKLYGRLEPKLESRQVKEEDLLVCCILPEDSDDLDVTPAFDD